MPMKLIITNFDAREYYQMLQPKFPEIEIHAFTQESAAMDLIENADVLMTIFLSNELMQRAKNLKWIQAITSGTDFIEKVPSFQARKDVILTSMRGIHGPQMSELAIMLMVALNRNFPKVIRNQERKIWEKWPATLLFGKKIGILGVGVIGASIARKCKAFEMTVLGIDPQPQPVEAVDEFYGLKDLHKVMSQVDYFISVAPYTGDNAKMINADAFSHMKPTAFFLNMGRGEVVDDQALIEALKNRRIAGAALDALPHEPLPPDHPYWEMENVIISPHVGGMSDIYVQQSCEIVEENLKRYLKGERKNLLNFIPRK
jgi:D-2-hydroxyacid dehydrogenase (NADP+)